MSKRKRSDELEAVEENAWTGYGFFRQLVASTRKNVHKVDLQYAAETEAGTVSPVVPRLFQVLSAMETCNIWVIRPKWEKQPSGGWKKKVPKRNGKDRKFWFHIDACRGLRAFAGNLLLGPRGEPVLDIPRSTALKLRTGTPTPKTMAKLMKVLRERRTNTKTMKGIRQSMGLFLVSLMVKHEREPQKLALNAFVNVCRWAIIDHIVRDLKSEGDKKMVSAIRKAMATDIDAYEHAGVALALKAGMNFIGQQKELKTRYEVIRQRVMDRMEAFLVDIMYKTTPDLQRVFAMEGKFKMGLAAERTLLNLDQSKSLSRPEVKTPKGLATVPEFNSVKRRAWLEQRATLNASLYQAMRRASTMPEDVSKGVIGFRFGGGSAGHRSPPATETGGLTMYLTPMLALADAARRGETSTVLWATRFDVKQASFRSGTVTGTPKTGFVHLDVAPTLLAQGHTLSMFLRNAAFDESVLSDAPESSMVRLSRLSALFDSSATNPASRSPLRLLIGKELMQTDLPDPIRHYLALLHEACHERPTHAAFWSTSMLVKIAGEADDTEKLGRLSMGSRLRDALAEGTTKKQRRWSMYTWLDGTFAAALFGFASVEVAKLNSRGHVA